MTGGRKTTLGDRIDQKLFNAIYSRSLVYNACWEDPAVDRQALNLTPADRMLVITSAGCNVLDYALTGVAGIHAVDANPRQTALLELKLAGIRKLDFDDFFALFGRGRHPRFSALYRDQLRQDLSPFARRYWDRNGQWFNATDPRDTFYHFGLSGRVARAFRGYLRVRPKLRNGLSALMETQSLPDQQRVWERDVAPHLWSKPVNWALSRQITMSFLGVPHPQRKEVQRQHKDGVAGFVRESIEYVARSLPLWTNYFWTLYLRGAYTRENAPEYLKPDQFQTLKSGLVDRISAHTCTVTEFLQRTDDRISRFVLLDHMDWMSTYYPAALVEEWTAILARATEGARVIFRSAHASPNYLAPIVVGDRPLTDRLAFDRALADRLQAEDRVHTYAGFHIADLRA